MKFGVQKKKTENIRVQKQIIDNNSWFGSIVHIPLAKKLFFSRHPLFFAFHIERNQKKNTYERFFRRTWSSMTSITFAYWVIVVRVLRGLFCSWRFVKTIFFEWLVFWSGWIDISSWLCCFLSFFVVHIGGGHFLTKLIRHVWKSIIRVKKKLLFSERIGLVLSKSYHKSGAIKTNFHSAIQRAGKKIVWRCLSNDERNW